jgi:hypothetical protein
MPKSRPVDTASFPNDSPDDSASALTLKDKLAEKRKATLARQELTSFLGQAAGVAIGVGLIGAGVGGVKGGLGGAVGIFCLMFSFKYPWQALYAFLIYLPLGGTITYSLGNSPLLQLAKDGFYLPALFAVYQYCQRYKKPLLVAKPLALPLGLLLGYCILVLLFVNGAQQFGPPAKIPEKPFFMGILGLKVLMGYIPLIPCAYYMVKKRQDLFVIMRLLAVLLIICCALGFLQYMFLKTGRCQGTVGEGAELFKASLEARCLVGGSLLYSEEQGVIRLPGTFVAPWQWGWYLIASAFFSFAVAFMDPKFLWKVVGLVAMAMNLLMAVLCGQRIALMFVPVVTVILLITTGQLANLKRFIPIGIAMTIILGGFMAANPAIIQERLDSAVGRWEAAPPTDFIAMQFGFVAEGSNSLLGKGLGRATNSARALGDVSLIETYYPKLMFEIGPLGAILFLALVTVITITTFKAYRSVRDRNLRGYGAAFWTFILIISYNTYYYPLDVDPVAVYYWFMIGLVLRLPSLEQDDPPPPPEDNSPKGQRLKRLAQKQKQKQKKGKKSAAAG